MGVADVHRMGEKGPRLGEPQRSCQCPGTRSDSAGETQGTSEDEGEHVWPVAGLGGACERLGPSPDSS